MASQQQIDRLHAVVPAAQTSARVYGVPASVTLAQWIIESSWGQSALALKACNCFGVKWTHKDGSEPYVEMQTCEIQASHKVIEMAGFVKYVSVADSFKAHASLLARDPRYAPAMLLADKPENFAMALQMCGYSTSPIYGGELVELMREHNLTQYDVPPDEPAEAHRSTQQQEAA